MTPRYPGARWLPTGPARSGYNSHRCMTHHEAVTTAGVAGIFGWSSEARACHGFTAEDGDAGQFVDFDEIVSGTLDGNGYALTWETWDDLVPATNRSPDDSHGPNDYSWTGEQVERQADIAAWMVDALGIPLHWMTNTREAGHAPHRLGVPSPSGSVDVGYGPDCWTSHAGKQCPGDRRIIQLRDRVLPRAAAILAGVRAGHWGYLPTGPVDLSAALARGGGSISTDDQDGWLDMGAKEEILAALKDRKEGSQSVFDELRYTVENSILPAVRAAQAAADKAGQQVASLRAVLFQAGYDVGGHSVREEVGYAMDHPAPGGRLSIVVDDSTGAWYAVGPGVLMHLANWPAVTAGQKAGTLDKIAQHVTADEMAQVRRQVGGGVEELYVKPATA